MGRERALCGGERALCGRDVAWEGRADVVREGALCGRGVVWEECFAGASGRCAGGALRGKGVVREGRCAGIVGARGRTSPRACTTSRLGRARAAQRPGLGGLKRSGIKTPQIVRNVLTWESPAGTRSRLGRNTTVGGSNSPSSCTTSLLGRAAARRRGTNLRLRRPGAGRPSTRSGRFSAKPKRKPWPGRSPGQGRHINWKPDNRKSRNEKRKEAGQDTTPNRRTGNNGRETTRPPYSPSRNFSRLR